MRLTSRIPLRPLVALATAALVGTMISALDAPSPAHAAGPADDPFYTYTGTTPLAQIPLGTPLANRTVNYSLQGVGLPLEAIQILYRARNQRGEAVTNVTSVVRPVVPVMTPAKVLSYQSFYDSLNPADEPSAVISGGQGLGGAISNVETTLFTAALLAGYTINIPDTEGQSADFAAGPEYGYNTLDSLRAISQVAETGVGSDTAIGMMGYSGGAIATEWAAELAPTYAPEIAARLVGSAVGGVFVHPGHNLYYIDGSGVWAGVMPMAIIGIARSFNVDFTPYLSERGQQVLGELENASIVNALGQYSGLTWAELVKPEYAVPESVSPLVTLANQLIMGTGGTPNAPMFIGQGTGGEQEMTSPSAEFGSGDGVMVAGDVRALAKKYCAAGVAVQHEEYPTSHGGSMATWTPAAYSWLLQRFNGVEASNNCDSIAEGNSLSPMVYQPPASPSPSATPTGTATASPSPTATASTSPVTPSWSLKIKKFSKALVGKKLAVTATQTGGAQVRYVWKVGGKVVKSGSARRLKLKSSWRGKKVTLVIMVLRDGAPAQRTLSFGRVR